MKRSCTGSFFLYLQSDLGRTDTIYQFVNLSVSVILIHQVLEELKQTNEKDCCRICENLLEKLTSQKDCLFVVTYMIEHLTGVLTEERVDVLHQTQIGCEVSSCQHTSPPIYIFQCLVICCHFDIGTCTSVLILCFMSMIFCH